MRLLCFLAGLGQIVLAQAFSIRQSASSNFTNPVIYEDFADNDIWRGPNDVYYFSASNMHYSPGAPVLQSYDLVNWEIIGHSVPTLAFGSRYNLTGGQAYRGGTWASTLRYRQSNSQWYWIGCVDFWTTYIYTADEAAGPWRQAAQLPGGTCYYDCGLLIDDDDTMYVAYGSNNVSIAQLSSDGLSQVRTENVFEYTTVGANGLEGNRMYKRNGTYYVLDDDPNGGTTYIWKSSSPWGPYTSKVLIAHMQSPVPGGSAPDQGSLIETPNGDWYYMSFTWAYPNGRMPILAPITWGSDDFPVLVSDPSGGWADSYAFPLPSHSTPSWTGTDTFQGTSLGPAWEWNHNPDPTKYSVNNGGGLTLSTATVTDDLYAARNTLTHRVHGPLPVGTVLLDISNMSAGDRCGLAAFRDRSASITISRSASSSTYTLSVTHNMTQDQTSWNTTSLGQTVASIPLPLNNNSSPATRIYLRASLDARSSSPSPVANFSYSLTGTDFVQLGTPYELDTSFAYFMGYRFGIFNYATAELGGSVRVVEFTSA